MQKPAGKRETEERLELLQLADAGDAADRKPAIPEDEAHKHAEDRDVGEPDPGGRTQLLAEENYVDVSKLCAPPYDVACKANGIGP